MEKSSSIDRINQATMRSSVKSYSAFSTLGPQEEIALASIADEVRGKRILDIGVGGGRTVSELLKLSTDYIGVDYVEEMVGSCRQRFAGVRFEWADARSMPQFADASFDLVVFAWAGICMVDHVGRLQILKEVRRILAPGGIFMFSTYNRNSAEHDAFFTFPGFQATSNPKAMAANTVRFVLDTAESIANRLRFKWHETACEEYSLINDKCHNYRTMLYYISLDQQRNQLRRAGFAADPVVFDTNARQVSEDDGRLGDSLLFIARA